MCWHQDEISGNFLSERADLIERCSAVENMAGCGRDPGVTRYDVQFVNNFCFAIPLVNRERKRNQRRCWSRKPGCIFERPDVCKMDGSSEMSGQACRRFDSLSRHFREVDRNKNASDTWCFHGDNIGLVVFAALRIGWQILAIFCQAF